MFDKLRSVLADQRDIILMATVALQAGCAAFFLFDVFDGAYLHHYATDLDQLHIVMESAAAIALMFGVMIMALELRGMRRRIETMERGMQVARGEVSDIVDSQLSRWGLTASEREVAWLMLKGFDNKKIAELRGVAVGTVRAQSARIYGKTGVKSRSDLFAFFMEDLMTGA